MREASKGMRDAPGGNEYGIAWALPYAYALNSCGSLQPLAEPDIEVKFLAVYRTGLKTSASAQTKLNRGSTCSSNTHRVSSALFPCP
jgi:hypothetical protein